MTNLKKFNQAQPAARVRLVNAAKTSLMLAPFALTGLAGAQDADITSLTSKAQGGVDAVKTGVLSIVGVVLVIGLLVWGSKHLRPSGK